MAAPVPRKTKPQGDQFMVSTQNGWLGGLNVDMSPASIESTETSVLHNMVAYRQGIRSVRGSAVVEGWEWPSEVITFGVKLFGVWQTSSGGLVAIWSVASDVQPPNIRVYYSEDKGESWSGAADKLGDAAGVTAVKLEEVTGGLAYALVCHPTTPRMYAMDLYKGIYGSVREATPLLTPTGLGDSTVVRSTPGYFTNLEFHWKLTRAKFFVSYPGSFNPADIDMLLHPEELVGLSPSPVYKHTIKAENLDWDMITHSPPEPDWSIIPEQGEILAVWRTKNVGYYYDKGTYLATGNDENQYYLVGFVSRSGSTITKYPVCKSKDYGVLSGDGSLFYMGMPLPMRSMLTQPITPLTPFRVSAGYMFIGKAYCSTTQPRTLGSYLEGVQELACLGEPTDIRIGADTALILSKTRTERVTLYSNINAGDSRYGEFYPVLDTPILVDAQVGVGNPKSIAPYSNAAFFAQCSDGSVRIWDGVSWSLDLTRGRMERLVRRALQDGYGIATSNGVYYIRSSTFGTLRLSIQEKAGNGWSTIGTELYPDNATPLVYRGDDGEHLWLHPENGDPPVEIEHHTSDVTYDNNADMVCRFTTREIEGTLARFYVRHLRTTVKFTPLPGKTLPDFGVRFKLFIDGEAAASQECRFNHRTNTAVFNGEAVGTRFRVEIETSAGGFFIPSIQTEFQSMDSRNLAESTTEAVYDEELNTGMQVWLSRARPAWNAISSVDQLDPDYSAPTIAPGYDGKQTAIQAASHSRWHYAGPSVGGESCIMGMVKIPASYSGELLHSRYIQLQAIGVNSSTVNIKYSGVNITESPLLTDTWYHLAFVLTETGCIVYLNGEEITSIGNPAFIDMAYLDLYVAYFWDLRVYNKHLSPQAIEAHWRDCLGGHFNYQPLV